MVKCVRAQNALRALKGESHFADIVSSVMARCTVSGSDIGAMVNSLLCYLDNRHSIITLGSPSHRVIALNAQIKRPIIALHEIQHMQIVCARGRVIKQKGDERISDFACSRYRIVEKYR